MDKEKHQEKTKPYEWIILICIWGYYLFFAEREDQAYFFNFMVWWSIGTIAVYVIRKTVKEAVKDARKEQQ